MQLATGSCYHLYNRSNRTLPLYYSRANYLYFLGKVRKEWLPHFDVIAYCLMPTHFHFVIYVSSSDMDKTRNSIGKLLSSYTRAINNQENLHGSLFQNHTKCKNLNVEFTDGHIIQGRYLVKCIRYIHNNPVNAGYVQHASDWEFSSFRDYARIRNGTLCNLKLIRYSDYI